jgi:hypothetical protein
MNSLEFPLTTITRANVTCIRGESGYLGKYEDGPSRLLNDGLLS